MRIDNITDLIAFKHIVKDGSLRAAAQKTGLSYAGVSKRLQRLEGQLGVRLINRSTRKLSLTEEGKQFYEYCVRILEHIEEAESVLSNNNRELKGSLHIALPDYFGRKHILPILKKLTTAYPKLSLSMDLSDRMVDIIEGGYDVAVRIGNMKDSNLVARSIGNEQRVVVASPDYLDKFGTPSTPEELSSHNALLYASPTPLDEWEFIGPNGETKYIRMSGTVRSNSCESLKEAVKAGMGVSLRPLWDVQPEIQSGALKVLLPDYIPPAFNVQVVFPTRQNLSLKARAFIDLVTDDFRGGGNWFMANPKIHKSWEQIPNAALERDASDSIQSADSLR